MAALGASGLIKNGDERDEIKVTLKGIYYVADNLNVPPESLGVLSRADVKKLENLFLQTLYEQTNGDSARTVDVRDIEKRIRGISGTPRFLQLADDLKTKGLIEIYYENGSTKFGVTSKEVKKYFPPPASPRPDHLLSGLSVRVSANNSAVNSIVNVRKNEIPTSLSVMIPSQTTGIFESVTGGELVGSNDNLDYLIIGGSPNIESVTVRRDGTILRLDKSP